MLSNQNFSAMSIQQQHHHSTRGELPYLFSEPEEVAASSASETYPLVVYLHGARDRGKDLNKLLAHGLPRLVAHNAKSPYYFLAPHIPEDTSWTDWQSEIFILIEKIVNENKIDQRRIILAGFSAGSSAALHFSIDSPDYFAGLVIVAGRISEKIDQDALNKLSRLPVWVFHGARDEGSPLAPVEEFVKRLKIAGGAVRFTVYPEGEHLITDSAYGDAALQRWLASILRRYKTPLRISGRELDPLFLNRWSPRALSGAPITEEALLDILEAARWAPSGGNVQPWRFLYVLNGDPLWNDVLALLYDNNRLWAGKGSALVLLVSKTKFKKPDTDEELALQSHSFDAGAAWGYLSLQASLSNWSTRAIGGFDKERAKSLFEIPTDFKVETLIAIGKLGQEENLPVGLLERESPSARRPLDEIVSHGKFSNKQQ